MAVKIKPTASMAIKKKPTASMAEKKRITKLDERRKNTYYHRVIRQ